MEDFQLDLIIGEGPAARSVRIDLARFTLVGATTRTGLLTTPLRDRFGIPVRLNFYTVDELKTIVTRGARVLQVAMTEDGASEIARRARGTPTDRRPAAAPGARLRLGGGRGHDRRQGGRRQGACEILRSTARGLDALDHRYLTCIAVNFGGGPVGIETIAASLSEPRDAIEEIIEPYLIQQGFVNRTPRGRMLTPAAFSHLHADMPAGFSGPQNDLFDGDGDE